MARRSSWLPLWSSRTDVSDARATRRARPRRPQSLARQGRQDHRGRRNGRWHHRVMSQGHAVQQELREPARALRRAIPEVYDGYRQMHAAAYAAGALDQKTKELIALAIAVNGGPGTVYGPRAFAAFREFAEEADPEQG